MVIFTDNNSAKFCQITLRIKKFIHKRKLVPFFCLTYADTKVIITIYSHKNKNVQDIKVAF